MHLRTRFCHWKRVLPSCSMNLLNATFVSVRFCYWKRILSPVRRHCIVKMSNRTRDCDGPTPDLKLNHYHVVLNVDVEKAESLSDAGVLNRWLSLYKGTELAQEAQAGELLSNSEHLELNVSIIERRERLGCLSRFMGNLNEHIARKVNKQDKCKGRLGKGVLICKRC